MDEVVWDETEKKCRSMYTITVKYDRNTVTCNTAKYGRIRSVNGMYTVVYDTVYDRLRPYTESVTIDLEFSFRFFYFSFCFFSAFFYFSFRFFYFSFRFFYFFFRFFYFSFRFLPNFLDEFSAFCTSWDGHPAPNSSMIKFTKQ